VGVKRLGLEVNHSPPSSAQVKECVELYFNSRSTPSWRGAQLKHRDNFNFRWSVVRCASFANGGTSKKRPSPYLHKVPPRSNKVSERTFQTALIDENPQFSCSGGKDFHKGEKVGISNVKDKPNLQMSDIVKKFHMLADSNGSEWSKKEQSCPSA
jgi:hypothetical protein